MINYDDNTLKAAIEKFGDKTQALVCVEELSELQKEILKFFNREEENTLTIKEEMADVLITIHELCLILNISDVELNEVINAKTSRLKSRI